MDLEFPRWMYRLDAQGEVEGRIFGSLADLPENKGWVETPAMLKPKHKDEQNAVRAENAAEQPGRQELGQAGETGGPSESQRGRAETQIRKAAEGAGIDRGRELEALDPSRGEGRGPLNFEGLSNETLFEIAKEAGVLVYKSWPRARIEQALREADG
jgi:hypothetical protein